MEKRGFAIAFKWIFALIAGLVIFLFLINFAYKHIYLSEKITSTVLLTNLETQLDSLSISEDIDTSLELNKEFLINFNCRSISLEKEKMNTEKIIFSNQKIKTNKLQVWTKTWSYPFAITNFFYVTDSKFYFFNPSYDLISKIPARFNVKTYPDYVQEDAVLIFFRQPSLEELSKYKNHKIKIIQNNQVAFLGKTIKYYGEEMLLGAVFTDDFNKFECLKNKALEKLKIISYVYQKKAETLGKIKCTDQYQLIINELEKFKTNPINPEILNNQDEELERNGCTPLFH